MNTQASFYPDVSASTDFAQLEQMILDYWKQQDCFRQSVEQHPVNDDNEFVFYDGPPFANGLPHYGHLLTGFIKDLVARYQTMSGKRVERRFGWDCHGLPAEMGAEKEIGISGRSAIMGYGIDRFNDHCRQSVMRYSEEWEQYVTRQARWVDFDNDYKTMNASYMESVLWAFKQLYDKGLVYQSLRVMPYSWACQTPLSNFETRMDNAYREKKSKAVTVGFELNADGLEEATHYDSVHLLAWTTTAWTLPSNLALAVNADFDYALVPSKQDPKKALVMGKFALATHTDLIDEDATPIPLKGQQLVGRTYKPLFDYFSAQDNAFTVLAADFVSAEDGTGVVHLAPGFGEDDFNVCQSHNIDVVCPIDSGAIFTSQVKDYAGRHIFDVNDDIIIALKQQGNWYRTSQYLHNYPHCWRTDTPLIYKAVPSWYVEVTKIKERMSELNKKIAWIPDHIGDGLFGKWLENARDWSISRNRFWGTPIPIWMSDNPDHPRIDVYGSMEELEADFGVEVKDLHRPFIDELTRPNPDDPSGKSTMRRVEDVFDCWFESGSMPFAQVHYPFENQDWFESHFSADFIVEYTAQTRGWFYTLMVLHTALFYDADFNQQKDPPFKNVICHGVVLDQQGQKLSKRLNNYPDPMGLFSSYGADALRWVMISSPIMHGGELLIDQKGDMVRDAVRLVIKPLWNAYHFFTLYANADAIQAEYKLDSNHVMDRYILAKCKLAVNTIDDGLQRYSTEDACAAVESFFDTLNNWYIRRNKERFWRSEKDDDKQAAYNTLYSVLHMMCRASAPLLPLTTEVIWLGLHGQDVSKK